MKVRLVEWQEDIYLVLGIGYDQYSDPPDVYLAIPLKDTIIRSLLINPDLIKIPFSEALEITDEKKVKTILILFG